MSGDGQPSLVVRSSGVVNWRGDGRELVYLEPNGDLVAVDVSQTRPFSAGPPHVLFRKGIASPSPYVEDYGVTADGQRFLLQLPATDSRPPELRIVLDWPALLAKPGDPKEAP